MGAKVMGMVTLDDLLMRLGQEMADMGQGVSGALFCKPEPAGGGRSSDAVAMVEVRLIDTERCRTPKSPAASKRWHGY
jgi:hypothetical protein